MAKPEANGKIQRIEIETTIDGKVRRAFVTPRAWSPGKHADQPRKLDGAYLGIKPIVGMDGCTRGLLVNDPTTGVWLIPIGATLAEQADAIPAGATEITAIFQGQGQTKAGRTVNLIQIFTDKPAADGIPF